MFSQDLTKENVEDVLLSDIEKLDDTELIEYGYHLQSVWDNLDEYDFNMDTALLSKRMREVYNCVLTRAKKTSELQRLAILIPSLPYLIYSPNLPDEE